MRALPSTFHWRTVPRRREGRSVRAPTSWSAATEMAQTPNHRSSSMRELARSSLRSPTSRALTRSGSIPATPLLPGALEGQWLSSTRHYRRRGPGREYPPGIQTGAPINNPPSDLHPSAHSVAADSVTGKTFWPIPANPPQGGGPQGDTPLGLCSFAGGDDTKGCILVVEGFVPLNDEADILPGGTSTAER